MICLKCFHKKTRIANSRQNKKSPITWRRHVCGRCEYTFTTYEKPVTSFSVTSDGSKKDSFSIGKLTISIARSFHHDKYAADFYSYDLATTIQERLLLQNHHTISTCEIAEMTHSTLQKFDQIAALQYAAQHKLIISRQKKRGRPSFSYPEHDSDHSSQQ